MPIPTSFARAVQDLLHLSTGHAALFLLGSDLALPTQQSLQPPAECGAKVYDYYTAAVSCSLFFVLAAFGSFAACFFVKQRVPDGGLQALAAWDRRVLRALAAVGFLLNVVASLLAGFTFTNILGTKLGLLSCQSLAVRTALYASYIVGGGILSTIYIVDGRAIVLAE